ncbi:DUF459 domain-containing protein [Neisseria sp. ZJ106]|uniref:DUF459 domain-containing protein n=1 Tax=Neisseria lisongii TaxID=2912188 RepID=A0ABY7RIF9_9NEIS|nr:DUF459 domain-containing protein [Neisseria lisongii]MCF7522161.1 DUF459 domain-containing protein [Neisseria lisongii]WCL71006.1 DUF459 domain-containing protein [Neisseria lisongii]
MKKCTALFVSLLLTAAFAAWFSQNSINAYWQQTYHQSSPLETLSDMAWWRTGGEVQQAAYQQLDDWKAALAAANGRLSGNETSAAPPEQPPAPAATAARPSENAASQTAADIQAQRPAVPDIMPLKKGDKVFFVGDSLMQGVAPFVQKTLKQQFDIESVNLSKQSTGLAYPKFFDWPATVENTLNQHPDISLMVVFLGPNDPWDFADPNGGKYLKFKSNDWKRVYQSRVARILNAAEQHRVNVIWLGVPFMKKQKLNEQMRYLDQVLAEAVEGRAKRLPTDLLLSNGKAEYTDSVTIDGKVVRYRSKDGIHFSPTGQKFLADYVMQHIAFQP